MWVDNKIKNNIDICFLEGHFFGEYKKCQEKVLGKKRWGSAVVQGYGWTSWGSGKEAIRQKFFPSSPSPTINLHREQNEKKAKKNALSGF